MPDGWSFATKIHAKKNMELGMIETLKQLLCFSLALFRTFFRYLEALHFKGLDVVV